MLLFSAAYNSPEETLLYSGVPFNPMCAYQYDGRFLFECVTLTKNFLNQSYNTFCDQHFYLSKSCCVMFGFGVIQILEV